MSGLGFEVNQQGCKIFFMVKFVVCPSLNHMFGRNSGSPRQAVVLACSGPGREWGGGGGGDGKGR